MTHKRQSKIVATLGPASADRETIRALYDAGADLFRLNFSHGTHEDHRSKIAIIRQLETELGHPIPVIGDLQGPKLRIGRLQEGQASLEKGQIFQFDQNPEPGDSSRACLPHPEVFQTLQSGAELLVDDGKIRMEVESNDGECIRARVRAANKIQDNKGVSLPGVVLPISPLTDKDRLDLDAALDMEVDFIALSFVQRAEDVQEARRLVGGRAALMVKLEKPSAGAPLESRIERADALMLARGDLGVEMPPERVPSLQKRIVRECRAAGKPVIVATQMLESMIQNYRPTRAEASDVANAVYDGTDAVMLSAETASGQYPRESVQMMDRICRAVESDKLYRPLMDTFHPDPERQASEAITTAAVQTAQTLRAAAIVTYTTTGTTTLRAARERPPMPVICITEDLQAARRLSLSYGVQSIHTQDVQDFEDMVRKAVHWSRELGLAGANDCLVITAGVPFGTPGSTNIMRVAWVD